MGPGDRIHKPLRRADKMLEMAKGLWKDEEGLTTVEYALLLALLVVAAIGVWTAFGGRVQAIVSSSSDQIDTASKVTPTT
jgi:Flp pilus assembly pilin Flp